MTPQNFNPNTGQPIPPPQRSNKTALVIVGVLLGMCALCGVIGVIKEAINPTPQSSVAVNKELISNTVLTNSNSVPNKNELVSKTLGIGDVCSQPSKVAINTLFSSLGGGSWGKWSDSSGELSHGCMGGKDSIKIRDDVNGNITAEYDAIGNATTVHYISAEYMAMQYAGLTPDEKPVRQQYADFCDKLSVAFYGQKLPPKFRKRLLDESTYSQSGTANEYAEKVGNGYVNLSSNKNKGVLVLLDVHFFSSELEYKKYKDS